jgi:acetyl-CoA C-acetyltransferase
VSAGLAEIVIACGVESMSRLPLGAAMDPQLGFGHPFPEEFSRHWEVTSQFEGAERIAKSWGIDRDAADEFGLRSQQLAAAAWAEGRFATQIVPVWVAGDAGTPRAFERDEGLRESSKEGLAKLKPVAGPAGVHTAGSASQISDGAAAVLIASEAAVGQYSLTPRARIRDAVLVGSDPELMLTGPLPATRKLLERNAFKLDDVDLVEINEAFAAVVLAWRREFGFDLERINPNGGAIALGHPTGATGAVLITKAVHELERRDGSLALVTMCCGGGLGTGMLLERVSPASGASRGRR